MRSEVTLTVIEQSKSAPQIVSAREVQNRSFPAILRWILPSLADILFLILMGNILLQYSGSALFQDADSGWHIRNGEWIIAHHAVPYVDWMSSAEAGKPWFAWEWLFDVLAACLHHMAGLNGLLLLTILLFAATFSLLYHFIARRTQNKLISCCLSLQAANCSDLHLLARPHVFSWLFTLLFVEILYRHKESNSRLLWMLPFLMVLWVNLHGGFIVGLALILLFLVAELWQRYSGKDRDCKRVQCFSLVGVLCGISTLASPYGYLLHLHIWKFLSNSYVIGMIQEFQSPNFHQATCQSFEIMVLVGVIGICIGATNLKIIDVLLLLFAVHAGLYAVRNIPLSAILLSYVSGIAFHDVFQRGISSKNFEWHKKICRTLLDFSTNLDKTEIQLRGHLVVGVVICTLVFAALHQGYLAGVPLLKGEFPTTSPSSAVDYLRTRNIHERVFSTDGWSGYLIYRMTPGFHVIVDDRFDLYGEEYMHQYTEAIRGGPSWQRILDDSHANRALLPPDLALSTLLRQSSEWKVEFEDNKSVIFCRGVECFSRSLSTP